MSNGTPDDEYDRALSGWFSTRGGEESDTLATGKPSAGHWQAIERVRAWVRERFTLDAEAAILVSEIACALPGCPPLETVVAFWDGATRHHFKLFKPVEAVTPDDLPYAWMKESLVVAEGFGCECC
jgi:hypothetical protein